MHTCVTAFDLGQTSSPSPVFCVSESSFCSQEEYARADMCAASVSFWVLPAPKLHFCRLSALVHVNYLFGPIIAGYRGMHAPHADQWHVTWLQGLGVSRPCLEAPLCYKNIYHFSSCKHEPTNFCMLLYSMTSADNSSIQSISYSEIIVLKYEHWEWKCKLAIVRKKSQNCEM